MSWIAVAVVGVGAAVKIGTGIHQNHLAKQIKTQYDPYTPSPYADEKMANLKNFYNSPMAGYQDMLRNLYGSQANFQAGVDRNATDSGQALALGGLGLGTTNNEISDLQSKQAAYKLQALNNLNQGYDTEINEGDKVYQSMLQRYMIDTQQKAALRGAGMNNISSGISDFGNAAGYGQSAFAAKQGT